MFNQSFLANRDNTILARYPLSFSPANQGSSDYDASLVGTVPYSISSDSPKGAYEAGPFTDSDYFSLRNGHPLKAVWTNRDQWMIDFWVKPTLADGGTFISWTNGATNLNLVQIVATLAFRFYTNGTFFDTVGIPNLLNNWWFVRVVGNGATYRRIYYGQNPNNMTRVTNSTTTANTGTIGPNDQFYFGRFGATTIPYHGKIKQIRFFTDISKETDFSQ